jgi:hypothetical protein
VPSLLVSPDLRNRLIPRQFAHFPIDAAMAR